MHPENLKDHIFTQYQDRWINEIEKSRVLEDPLNAPEYDNAVLLPMRRRSDICVQNVCSEGGVCSSDGRFITGLTRALDYRNPDWSCKQGYQIPEQCIYRDETVMYGGVLIAHFGHTLLDSLARMWWWVKHRDEHVKIVFLRIPGQHTVFDCFLSAAGLKETDWEIVDIPTRFRKIIVPDEAMYAVSMVAHRDWLLFFDAIKKRVTEKLPPPASRKIYLTRRLLPESEGVNEEYYEDFYARRGYQIIAPETLPFEEQVNYIANAEKIVCPMGTLSHFAVFASEKTVLTILLRTAGSTILPQIIINRVCRNNWYLVEACQVPLPTSHSHSLTLYVPTRYFEHYLDTVKEPYEAEELNDFQISDELYIRYFKEYASAYANPNRFRLIAGAGIYDVVSALNLAFFGRTLPSEQFSRLENRSREENLRRELNAVYNSKGWRLYSYLKNRSLIGKIGMFCISSAQQLMQKSR